MYLNSLDSGNFVDIVSGIDFDKNNKFSLQYISSKIKTLDNYVFYMNSLLDQYRDLIMSNVVDLKVDPQAYYLPELVSKTIYGTTDLWYLLLYCNNMCNKYEFTKPLIKAMAVSDLDILNNIIESNKKKLVANKADPFLAVDCTLVKIV
jgi:hypothetical protein